MKYQKIVNELDSLLDKAAHEQEKRQKKLQDFLRQFTSEEQKLRVRLESASDDSKRTKLEAKLKRIRLGYELLEPNLRLRQV